MDDVEGRKPPPKPRWWKLVVLFLVGVAIGQATQRQHEEETRPRCTEQSTVTSTSPGNLYCTHTCWTDKRCELSCVSECRQR